MVFKAKISVKTKLNCFVLHFKQISLRYNKFHLYCSLLKSTKLSKHKGLSEENKNQILEVEELRNEKKGETIINYSVKALRKSYLRAMNYIWTHAIQNTYEIIFSGFTGIFKDILVKSLLLLLFLQRYSCSILVLAFQLCGCRPDYNILKQLVTAFLKKRFFFKILFLNYLITLYR